MTPHRASVVASIALAVPVLIAGCNQPQRPNVSPEPTVIPISKPVSREITDYVEFTGRVNAVNEAAARVKAYESSTEVYKLNLDFTLGKTTPSPPLCTHTAENFLERYSQLKSLCVNDL